MTPAELRELFDDESTVYRMTSSSPPVTLNIVKHVEDDGYVWFQTIPEEELPDPVGQSLSGELVALIAGIRADRANYGPRHPMRRALSDWGKVCRRRHRGLQWWDHQAHPALCGDMLRAMIEGGASVLWCSEQWGVPYPRVERHLLTGAAYVSRWVLHWDHERAGIPNDRDCDVCKHRRIDLRPRGIRVARPTT